MTPKRYRLHINRKKYDYAYDQEAGVAWVRLPGTREEITIRAPTPTIARNDVRRLIEQATGQKAERPPERTQFLRAILMLTGNKYDISENDLATALAKVSDALTQERRRTLGIDVRWRAYIAHASSENDPRMIGAADAAKLAEIAVFGKVTLRR